MNTRKNLVELLAVAAVVMTVNIAFVSCNKGNDNAAAGQAVIENIMTRTSIRAYTQQPVEKEQVEQLLRAAMAAPSAGNKQPWRFVVVEEKALLGAISTEIHTASMVEKAPLAIVVCGDMNDTFPDEGLDYWVEDASAATENLLLAAHAMGLGAVWCGIYPLSGRVDFLKRLLNLPTEIVPLGIVPVGYPAEDPTPKDKWKPENIHYNTWDGSYTPIE